MNVKDGESLFQRTVQRLVGQWRDISAGILGEPAEALRPDLPDADAERIRRRMRACLDGQGGEVSARARAAELGRAYLSLNRGGRARFLRILAADFDTDRRAVAAAALRLDELDDWGGRKERERQLRQALEPPRRRLLTQFNALPDGVKFLVDMRAALIELAGEDPLLADLEADLKALLASWFDIGFLELKRITWETSAAIIEKLIEYEAVHQIRDWDDMKSRLASDRRCYAYFHPRMPEEPLIFVEVALTEGIASSIDALLDERGAPNRPNRPDSAIFYSISNAQRGLDGIGFGGFLIKRVVEQLAAEFDGLNTFATLSPIPGFKSWLDDRLAGSEDPLLNRAERRALATLSGESDDSGAGDAACLARLLNRPGWPDEAETAQALAGPLTRLCARYLAHEKRTDGRARDPVAHFHLSNGARMERLNWLADRSAKGIAQSAGLMINYLYDPEEIPANHEAYAGDGDVPASSKFRALLR